MKPSVLTVLAFNLVISAVAVSQSVTTGPITTLGQCGVVVVGPKNPISIICDQKGLSPAEARKQAEEYAKILTFIKQNGLKTDVVLQKLDSMAKDISDIKVATAGRHLTGDQRVALAAAMEPFAGTVVRLQAQSGDAEASSYVEDFLMIFNSGHLNIENGGTYAQTSVSPRPTGILLYVEPSVSHPSDLPVQCSALYRILLGFGLPSFRVERQFGIAAGSCTLSIFSSR